MQILFHTSSYGRLILKGNIQLCAWELVFSTLVQRQQTV